jgi:acetyl esterase/lipase
MTIRLSVLIGLLTCSVAAQSRNPLELATAPAPAGAIRIAYGSDPMQFGELHVLSTKGPHPLAIVVHGGCWLAKLGDLDPRAVAMDNMRPLAAALNDAGIATWNIEYRRIGSPGGGWPGTFRDVGSGADFVRTLTRDQQIDLTRVIAVGHSAGAHLALWLAARPKLMQSSELYVSNPLRVTGVVSLDGPADLKATIPLQRPVCGAPVITDLIGGSPEERPAVRCARCALRGCHEEGWRPRPIGCASRRGSLRVHRSAVRRLAAGYEKRSPVARDG